MTDEQAIECREHLDAIIEITSGTKLTTLFADLQKQMNLPNDVMHLVFKAVLTQVQDAMIMSFTQTGEYLQQAIQSPDVQAALRAKIRGED
jgi:hypothetical protein